MVFISYNNNVSLKKINNNRIDTRKAVIEENFKCGINTKNKKYYEVKKLEKEFIKEKYSLDRSRVDFILKSYLTNSEIPSGSIYNLEKLLEFILKNIYEFNEEQMASYINNHLSLFNYSFDDVSLRIALFYHFAILDDILFGNVSYLKSCYPRETINTKEIYAIMMEYNVNNFNELREIFNSIYDEDLVKLVKKYPLSEKIIYEFNEELKSKINKKAFMLELKRRKSMKEKK